MKIHYHSDHLGSASFVTNAEGAVVQHLQYLPYGELFVSQRNTEEFDSRYKFTAKELDNETSYTYFGARYYDSELSVWLSVDPMSDKYPSLSPYCYTADNPVVLVDPNGTSINPIYDKETSEFLGTDDRGLQGEAIIMNKEDFLSDYSPKLLYFNLSINNKTILNEIPHKYELNIKNGNKITTSLSRIQPEYGYEMNKSENLYYESIDGPMRYNINIKTIPDINYRIKIQFKIK